MGEWYLWVILILAFLLAFSLAYFRRRRAVARVEPPEEVPLEVRGREVETAGPVEAKPFTPIKLTEIKGIGAKRAEKLMALGINTVQDLARFSPEELAERTSISKKLLSSWIEQARKLIKQAD